jgi:hypothetical protein
VPDTKEVTVLHSLIRGSGKMTTSLVMTIALTTCWIANAAASPNTNGDVAAAPNKKVLVGSWLETVTFPPETGRPSLKSLGTFHADGTMMCSDQGGVTTTPPPSVYSSCHGVWTHLYKRTFAYTSLVLISDLSGNLAGYLKVRGVYTVSPSGNHYTGTSFAQVLDPDGNVLFAVNVTNAGRRIQIDLP